MVGRTRLVAGCSYEDSAAELSKRSRIFCGEVEGFSPCKRFAAAKAIVSSAAGGMSKLVP
jgi:hypothetical protein